MRHATSFAVSPLAVTDVRTCVDVAETARRGLVPTDASAYRDLVFSYLERHVKEDRAVVAREAASGSRPVPANTSWRSHPQSSTPSSGSMRQVSGATSSTRSWSSTDLQDRRKTARWGGRAPVDELRELVSSGESAVFVAESDGNVVGFMGIRIADAPNVVAALDAGIATLDGIGAYLEPEARNQGAGDELLRSCLTWARDRADRVHVDFESANPSARSFWLRYFTAYSYSLMRVTHRDTPIRL